MMPPFDQAGSNEASALQSSLSSSMSSQMQQTVGGGLSFQSNGLGVSIEPAFDIKCKEENTVDIEVCAKFSIGDENQG